MECGVMGEQKLDPLKALRSYRAPFWARAIGAIRAWRRLREDRKRWRLVASVNHWTWWTDAQRWDHCTFHCFQRGDGARRCEHMSTSILLKNRRERNSMYIEVIVPWINGRYSNEQIIETAKRTEAKPTKVPS